jgi:hypothetical protein
MPQGNGMTPCRRHRLVAPQGGIEMQISEDHVYEHGADAVYALFTDPSEIEAKQEMLGAREIRILECETDADGAVVRFERELPAEVPGFLSQFLQPWNRVAQSEVWRNCGDDGYEADLTIDVANVPVTVGGTLEIRPTEDGCVNQVRLRIECGIPLVGKTLAEFVAADCERLIALEYDYITERLGAA